MTNKDAKKAVEDFMAFFADDAEFYTSYWFRNNIDYDKVTNFFHFNGASHGGLLDDKYETTLDAGVIVVDKSQVGIMWFGDID